MAYNPLTDFLTLLRNVGGVAAFAEMPGLDYVVAAMARAGLFRLWTGQSAPTVNQATTIWLSPSTPSWVAEGAVFLWNAASGTYEPATPALWAVLFAQPSFQSIQDAAGSALAGTTLLAIRRAAPAATTVQLPSIASQGGKPLKIVDWSTSVATHDITLKAAGGETVMRQTSWQLFSTADQLAGVTLHPSLDLNAWIIAP